jgi:hypothetical protein
MNNSIKFLPIILLIIFPALQAEEMRATMADTFGTAKAIILVSQD